jgi:phosphate transport system substrate-binding protein
VRTVPIAAEGGAPVDPTLENAVSGRYALSRHLFMITRGEPSPAARDFLDWVRTPAGQALVNDAGFYPLPAEQPAGQPAEE